jgi:acetyltransferase-like isoleucine patch superfamily enzyme
VVIGRGCRLGPFSKIIDNNFHPVSGDRNLRPSSRPVILEDGVELGARAIVLPGAWLESGVTIGAGAVVSRRVKSGLTLIGLPARVERRSP